MPDIVAHLGWRAAEAINHVLVGGRVFVFAKDPDLVDIISMKPLQKNRKGHHSRRYSRFSGY